ncbi:hypothetical protein DKG75_19595 [Zavarzinia compransoris]|uniref:Uncharacterized protein n=2 Tax=Zavarzinia compransoris TaxID=1264899 RepID=A0A317DWU4_9PROT|nr:hypothetical protein DKG75_19595 [Zavarzinia compransoris]
MERQAAIVIGALLTAGVVWLAGSVSETTAVIAGLKVQIEGLREQVGDLKAGGRDALAAEEARREFGRLDGRLADLEGRLRRIERAVPGGNP